jgi:hypothetical protein
MERTTTSPELADADVNGNAEVLVGKRRAEQCHDPVAHDLVDGALVAVHGLHHVLDDGVEQLPRLLGVAVGEQLHRGLEVGKEDGDLFTLARQGGLRGEDLLGEVFGGVRLRGVEPRGSAWHDSRTFGRIWA